MTARGLRRALDVGRAEAAAYGQIFFCRSPLSGLCFLAGLTALAPTAAWAGAAGGGLATLVACARGYPAGAWRSGLYGYTGVLAGLFFGTLFAPDLTAGLVLALLAAASAPLTRTAHRILTPHELPTLVLPALCLVWLATPFLEPAAATPPVGTATQIVGWSLLLAGLAVHSRLGAFAAVIGAGVGFGMSRILLGPIEPWLLSNTVLTAVALGGVFLPWSGATMGVAAFGAGAAGLLWWLTSPTLGAWGLPPLVAPFHVVTVIILCATRFRAIRRWLPGLPTPLPLATVGRPEDGRASCRTRRQLHDLVREAGRLVVLTGAGVSTAAGLPDFQDAFGLWNGQGRITVDDFLSSAAVRESHWLEEERFFHRVQRASPTETHRALFSLYRHGRLTAVITQNVDGLHQAAGLPPASAIELHGNIHQARCVDCGRTVARATLSAQIATGVTTLYCDRCQGLLTGGSLLLGERVEPGRLEAALRAVLSSDLLLVLGTSLAVAPASDLLQWARTAGIPVAMVNASPTPYDSQVTVKVTADVGPVLCDLLEDAVLGPMPQTAAHPVST